MPLFTGEVLHFRLYEFTPDAEHDPSQSELALPRVLWLLDDFPINDGQTMLIVRDPEAIQWDDLSDAVVGALAVVTKRLRRHMKSALTEATSVSILNSETSIPEPHELFVPVHDRKDPQRLWDRTYAEETRATNERLSIMQQRLAVPEELKRDLDAQLAVINWGA